jgi:hypothetical protein
MITHGPHGRRGDIVEFGLNILEGADQMFGLGRKTVQDGFNFFKRYTHGPDLL